ncbi:MAG: PIN domain-containing protein [Anaerolineae bacterium]
MPALLDTGFLYATVDAADKNHTRVIQALAALDDVVLLPSLVLVETSYLLQARLGHAAMRQFIQRLETSPIPFVSIVHEDLPRIHELLEQYADLELDLVDAAIVTLAERLNIRRILTLDQRDFRTVRPRHCDYFEIVP